MEYQKYIDWADDRIVEDSRKVVLVFAVLTLLFGAGLGNVSTNAGTQQLAGHLRSEDFFAVDQYPTSTLDTTSITPATSSSSTYNVTADLTMKGTTNQVSFPATIGMQENQLIVRANTEIDRSRWSIRYGSPSFFNDLGDNVIGDMVDISVDLVADAESANSAATSSASN